MCWFLLEKSQVTAGAKQSEMEDSDGTVAHVQRVSNMLIYAEE